MINEEIIFTLLLINAINASVVYNMEVVEHFGTKIMHKDFI